MQSAECRLFLLVCFPQSVRGGGGGDGMGGGEPPFGSAPGPYNYTNAHEVEASEQAAKK